MFRSQRFTGFMDEKSSVAADRRKQENSAQIQSKWLVFHVSDIEKY